MRHIKLFRMNGAGIGITPAGKIEQWKVEEISSYDIVRRRSAHKSNHPQVPLVSFGYSSEEPLLLLVRRGP